VTHHERAPARAARARRRAGDAVAERPNVGTTIQPSPLVVRGQEAQDALQTRERNVMHRKQTLERQRDLSIFWPRREFRWLAAPNHEDRREHDGEDRKAEARSGRSRSQCALGVRGR
jgi:hypothetical protein